MDPEISANSTELHIQKQRGQFCDVTLFAMADDTRIMAHRRVLQTASQRFAALDSPADKNDEITLAGISGAVLGKLIDYAYTGHIDIDASNVLDIFFAAVRLAFYDVIDMCGQVFLNAIDQTKAHQYLPIFKRYRLNNLQLASALESETAVGFLENEGIRIDLERDVFNVIDYWNKMGPKPRQSCHTKLLKITSVPRFKCMLAAGRLNKSGNIQIERYTIASNTWEDVQQISGLDRCHLHCVDNWLYLFEYRDGNMVVRSSLATMEFEVLKPMQNERFFYASVAAGRYVYCIGGLNDAAAVKSVERYDTKNNDWADIEMLNHGRHGADAVFLTGKIYVIGGFANDYMRSVERYDPATKEWTNMADLNVARAAHRCCAMNGFIYAVGGYHKGFLASIEKYDAHLDRWTIIQHGLDVPRRSFGIGASDEWIYITGGVKSSTHFSNDLLRINVTDGRIEKLSSMTHKMRSLSCVMTQ